MSVTEGDKKTRLIFTGDIGQPNQPIIEDPAVAGGADFIITESTYGNRIHEAYDKEGDWRILSTILSSVAVTLSFLRLLSGVRKYCCIISKSCRRKAKFRRFLFM